jgi:hypothetical protein
VREEKVTREVKVEIVYREYGTGSRSLKTLVDGEEAGMPEEIELWIAESYVRNLFELRRHPELLTEGKK